MSQFLADLVTMIGCRARRPLRPLARHRERADPTLPARSAAVAYLAANRQLPTAGAARSPAAHRPVTPRLVVKAPAAFTTRWVWFASVGGRPAARISRRRRITLMRFEQPLVHLDLHAGWRDGGPTGWRY